MGKIDVQPSALLDAARGFYAVADSSRFKARADQAVGQAVWAACDGFVARLDRAAITKEMLGLARALELSSGTYLYTETRVSQAADRGD